MTTKKYICADNNKRLILDALRAGKGKHVVPFGYETLSTDSLIMLLLTIYRDNKPADKVYYYCNY